MLRARPFRRCLLVEWLQAVELRGRMHQSVETAAFALDRGGEIEIVLRRRTGQIHRIRRRLRRAETLDFIVE